MSATFNGVQIGPTFTMVLPRFTRGIAARAIDDALHRALTELWITYIAQDQ
jgi:hypothetical protein